jgi:hypothetical protein
MKCLQLALNLGFFLIISLYSYGQNKETKRLSPTLLSVLKNKDSNELISLVVAVKELEVLHKEQGIQILAEYKAAHAALIRTTSAKLSSLIDKGQIIFADTHRQPKDELTTESNDLSLNKISLAHNKFPAINGDSIIVSLNEERYDTSDIDIKGRHFETGLEASAGSSHAAIMATLLTGGGNSSPFGKGAGWGAVLTSSDYASLLPDPDSIYRHYKISIQNHSYGTGIENYYGADAAAYDMSVQLNPTLLHVFSSGNSGTSAATSGNYSGIQGFANLTGSFKMAKNIITVGATDSFNHVAPLSSKGPAYDGRIKPDLVAFGEDGSSGAAALVSGTATLLQQAYREENHHLPSAALVKAILLNSADDINNKHVDYESGFGSLNANAALKDITEHKYVEDSVIQGQIKSFSISIPTGIAQLKVLLTWNDTAAIANASKALVNDLDVVLLYPATGESWQPWVLSSYPNKDSLLLPAVRKKDTLNNVEQITLDNPQVGSYTIQVNGSHVQTIVPQAFAITWQIDTAANFTWTYPSTNDLITAGQNNVIRWQTNSTGNATIEYSTNGVQWQPVATGVDLSDQYYKWSTPNSFTKALLRITTQNSSITSDTFVISKPLSLNVGFNCADSFLLYWNKADADQYQLYQLGQKYLEPIITTADTFIILHKSQFPSLNYNVAPMINGRLGQQGFTIDYTIQGVGCYFKTFYAILQDNQTLLTTELGTLYNVAQISFQKWNGSSYQTIKTFVAPNSTSQSFIDDKLIRGGNLYRVEIRLTNGKTLYSSIESVIYFPDQPLIIFPNPVLQNQPINIAVKDPGVYSIRVFDVNGRLVKSIELDDLINNIPPFSLSKGLYFVQVNMTSSKLFVQKIIVY